MSDENEAMVGAIKGSKEYKYRFVIEVEGNQNGFHGMLVDGPSQIENKPYIEKIAVAYVLTHVLANNVYELANPEDPEVESNRKIAQSAHDALTEVHESLLALPGVLVCPCLPDVEVTYVNRLAFVLEDAITHQEMEGDENE